MANKFCQSIGPSVIWRFHFPRENDVIFKNKLKFGVQAPITSPHSKTDNRYSSIHDNDEWVSIIGQRVLRALSHAISRIAGGTRLRLWAFGAKLKPSESKRQVSSKTKQRELL